MSHPIFTPSAVEQILTRIVQEKGEDYIYVDPTGRQAPNVRQCFYSTRSGQPSCGVGYVIHALVPEEKWREVVHDEWERGIPGSDEWERSIPASKDAFSLLTEDFGLDYEDEDDRRVISALERFQSLQDTGSPWGEALERFQSYVTGEE